MKSCYLFLTKLSLFTYSNSMKSQPQAAGITVDGSTAVRLPWNGIVLDLALFAWAGVLSLTAFWIRRYLAWIFNWIWLLQALTFYSVMAGFVLAAPPPPKKFALNRITLFILGAGLISIFSPIWMFATPLAGRGSFIGLFWNTAAGIASTIIVCLLVFGKYYSRRITKADGLIRFIFPILYLAVSELLLYDTSRAGGIGVGFVLRGMFLSYIPFRLLMILTPPRSAFEIMTAAISLGWFLLILTGVISF
jgi:hypothetical protein